MDSEIIDAPETSTTVEDTIYPGIIERLKALMTDGVILVVLMLSIGMIFSKIENVPEQARMIAFVFIFLLYDPLCTSIFGGTIGHLAIGIRVQRDDDSKKNILPHLALIRYILKAALGWVSLLTINSNDKGKAIHDLAVNSVVVYKK